MKKLKKVRIRIPHRVIAFLLAWAIILTSLPYQRSEAQDDTQPNLNGIGIYNHVLTGQSDLQTVYHVKFYQTEEYTVKQATETDPAVIGYRYKEFVLQEEYRLFDNDSRSVYLDSDGEMILEQGQIVNFVSTANESFKNFLIAKGITRIVIDVACYEMRDGQNVKNYEQYESPSQKEHWFSGTPAEYDSDVNTLNDPADAENIPLARQIYMLQYYTESGSTQKKIKDIGDYKVKQYDLTPMVDYDVYVQWRDTNASRPSKDSVLFGITRAEGSETPEAYITGTEQTIPEGGTADTTYGGVYAGTEPAETVHRTMTEVDSNNIVYTYSVPERSADNQPYSYDADEKSITDYYIETGTDSHFANYHLTEFSCTIKWGDVAIADKITRQITPQFIREHFELVDETDQNNPYNVMQFSAATFATTKPTPCKAFCIEFHTDADVLLNSIVSHLPGFSIL